MDYKWVRGRLPYIDEKEILFTVLEEIINELERLNKEIEELKEERE